MHIFVYLICLYIANDCGQLQDPEYGEVTITGTTTGSVATYSCNKGFKLTGNVNRICLVTGQWSRTAPTCQRKKFLYYNPIPFLICS